jgi:hypothetical protein
LTRLPGNHTHLWILIDTPGILAKYKVPPFNAERALAPISPPNSGISAIFNGQAIDSFAIPRQTIDPVAVILHPSETTEPTQAPEATTRIPARLLPEKKTASDREHVDRQIK